MWENITPHDLVGAEGDVPDDVAGIGTEVAEVALEERVPHAIEGATALIRAKAIIVLPEIAATHHFVEELLTRLSIGRAEEAVVGQGEDALHQPHCGAGEAIHPRATKHFHRLGLALWRGFLEEHIVVVHQLAQTDAFAEVVAEDVEKDVVAVEIDGQRIDGVAPLGNVDAMMELAARLLLKIAVEMVVGQWLVEIGGLEMHFYLDVVEEVEMDVMGAKSF